VPFSIERCRAAAASLAGQCLALAREDANGVYWVTAAHGPSPGTYAWLPQSDLYAGSGGIAAFLNEAASILGASEFRDCALSALRWSSSDARRRSDYGYYAGRLGLAHAMLRAHELTGDSQWVEESLRLAQGAAQFVTSAPCEDLLIGTAGAALGAMHVHAATGDRTIGRTAEDLLQRLVATARWTPEGACWDVRRDNIRGLCGLSHGSSGIGLVLLEAAAYFDQPAYRTLAFEAFRYESSFYDPVRLTWPDFRKAMYAMRPGFEAECLTTPDEFLLTPSVMEAWCHGAPGIGLARLRAFELCGEEWLADLKRAITRTEYTLPDCARTVTLCHGACGNAVLLLEAGRVMEEPRLVRLAEEAGGLAIVMCESGEQLTSGYPSLGDAVELSLMMGNAGAGYFLLQLLSGEVPNVLFPRLNGHSAASVPLSEGDVVRTLTASLLPRTMQAIGQRAEPAASEFFTQWRTREESLAFCARQAPAAGADNEQRREEARLRMRDDWPSLILAYVQEVRVRSGNASFEQLDDPLRQPLRLASYVRLWSDEVQGTSLLRVAGNTVIDMPLTPLAVAVLREFETTNVPEKVIRKIVDDIGDDDGSAFEAVRRQIVEAVRAGLLEVAVSPAVPTAALSGSV